ncbi:MAG: VOC family protein [Alphaproteobacteria bacterium]|nr:VOC family protein [Alphaproteobacteria bacterium]MBL7098074.1 VOC family protein [Alphaproteobacteria bacterium]
MPQEPEHEAVFLEAAPFLLVDDVVKSGKYWRDVLGFNLGRYFGNPPGFTIMQRNSARVMLRQAPAQPAAITNTSKLREALDLYIWVSDVTALADELKRRGADIVNPPELEDGRREMLVRDLNGYLICFGEVRGWPY